MGSGRLWQYVATISNYLSTMAAGAAYCWFEPITLRLQEDPELNFTSKQVSWVIAILEVGAVIGPLLSGYFTERIGRKFVIMSIGPLCLAGWILILCSKSMLTLVVVRILHGLAIGVTSTIPPIYTAEIAEPEIRGRLSGIYQVALDSGAIYSFCFGPYLSYNVFVYVCLPLPIIFTMIWIFMPETPYYLLKSEREDEARKVLKCLRDADDIEEELQDMQKAIREHEVTKGSWKTLFYDKVERKAFIIAQIVCMTKYMSGLPVIMNYALEACSKSDSFLSPKEMSILIIVFLTLSSFTGGLVSDCLGRRPLLLISCFGCSVAHFLSGGCYYIHEKTSIEGSNYTWALYIGLALYCLSLNLGLGPLQLTLQAEMFGASTRGIACGITEGFASIISCAMITMFAQVNEKFGLYLNFWIYSLVALAGGLLLSLLMHETAGKTIGQTQNGAKSCESSAA